MGRYGKYYVEYTGKVSWYCSCNKGAILLLYCDVKIFKYRVYAYVMSVLYSC